MFNTDTIQKMSHDQISTIQAMGGAVAKGAQQITTETTDYSKKTMEQGSAVAEKMLGAKSLEALVQIALGGQCAEELFFGDVSTGPAGDLLYATNCAAEMVGAHGMDGSLISYMAIQNSGFSDTNIVGRVLADDRGRDAVEALLQRHKVTVQGLLSDHRHLVEALRDALVERHELVGHEITDVLEAAHATVAAPVVVDLRDPLADQADAPTP